MIIQEFEKNDYFHALQASMDSDLVIVRNIASEEEISKLANIVPASGRELVIKRFPGRFMSLSKSVSVIDASRDVTRALVEQKLGSLSTLKGLYAQRLDRLCIGSANADHIDHSGISFSTSITLSNSGNAIAYGKRILEFDAPADKIMEQHQELIAEVSDAGIEMGVGDAAIFSRGVAHRVLSSPGRQSAIFRTKGIVT